VHDHPDLPKKVYALRGLADALADPAVEAKGLQDIKTSCHPDSGTVAQKTVPMFGHFKIFGL